MIVLVTSQLTLATKIKIKRGFGVGLLRPHFHHVPTYKHIHHGVSSNVLPVGLNGFYHHHHPKAYNPSIYSRIPGIIKAGVAPYPGAPHIPTQFAITHGGASVQSFSANYPRFPVFPSFQRPLATPVFPQSAPTPVFPQPAPTPVFPQHAPTPVFPQQIPASFFPQPAPAPLIPVGGFHTKIPVVPFVHQKPLVPNAFYPNHGVLPANLQPQFIPIPVGSPTPTIFNLAPTATTSTSTTTLLPQQPWRPVVLNPSPSTPTVATVPTITKPPSSLLPPINLIAASAADQHHHHHHDFIFDGNHHGKYR